MGRTELTEWHWWRHRNVEQFSVGQENYKYTSFPGVKNLQELAIQVSNKIKWERKWVLVAQLCPTLCTRMDYSLPVSSVLVGSRSLLQVTFQGWNPGLLHDGQILYHLSHQRKPEGRERALQTIECYTKRGLAVTTRLSYLSWEPNGSECVKLLCKLGSICENVN